jgi:hypothetical protein
MNLDGRRGRYSCHFMHHNGQRMKAVHSLSMVEELKSGVIQHHVEMANKNIEISLGLYRTIDI